ncbi:MAG: hypothetical protein JXB29_01695, partial [Sedimentisphaerales bacterium]|nr:hypothetical protein [Sedimentisphaerales bacterium]
VGQIEQFILNKPEGKRHIEKGYRLAPYDPTVCFVAGQLQASDGQLEASYTKLKQAVRLDGAFFEDAADVYIKQVKQPELAVALAGDDIWRLSHVVNRLTDQGGHEELINKVSDRLSKILEEKCSKPDAPAWALATMARLCQRENRKNDAIEYYRSALVLEYAQVEWRLNLAKLLTEMNQINNAVHEAEICLRLHPGMQGAQALLEKLSGMSAAITDRNATSTSQ